MGACATAWAPFIFLEEEKNNEKTNVQKVEKKL